MNSLVDELAVLGALVGFAAMARVWFPPPPPPDERLERFDVGATLVERKNIARVVRDYGTHIAIEYVASGRKAHVRPVDVQLMKSR